MGCDLMALVKAAFAGAFQSTHPHGVRLAMVVDLIFGVRFQSTHPHGVRQYKGRGLMHITGFNPRTHMGCDIRDRSNIDRYGVSIHAPTWGATYDSPVCYPSRYVSIHAPTWGATFLFQASKTMKGVSIHAPTWGATCVGRCCHFPT